MWTPHELATYNEYLVQLASLPALMGQQIIQPWAAPINGLQHALPNPALSDNENGEDDSSDSESLRTLFIANLDERITEEVLYEVFLQAGPIESVRIPKDNNGKQRTFGFVTYVHLSAPPYAMHLYQGLELYRKRVTIKFRNSDQLPNLYTLPDELEAQFGNRCHVVASNSLSNGSSNPFSQDLRNTLKSGHGRHSFHGVKPYDRTPAHLHNRRSDSMVDRSRDWDRGNRMQPYHSGGNRRSDQRSGGGVHRR